jgi:hypothetical protein
MKAFWTFCSTADMIRFMLYAKKLLTSSLLQDYFTGFGECDQDLENIERLLSFKYCSIPASSQHCSDSLQ